MSECCKVKPQRENEEDRKTLEKQPRSSSSSLWISSANPFTMSLFPGLSEDDPEVRNFPPTFQTTDFGNFHQIIPKLFLGNIRASTNFTALTEMNVSHILEVLPNSNHTFPGKFTYFTVSVYDSESTNILEATNNFTTTNNFIEEGIRNKGVFVHCFAGCSRSATIVIAYLMAKEGMSYVDAAKFVKLKRKIISPNVGFIKQLLSYEQQQQQQQHQQHQQQKQQKQQKQQEEQEQEQEEQKPLQLLQLSLQLLLQRQLLQQQLEQEEEEEEEQEEEEQ